MTENSLTRVLGSLQGTIEDSAIFVHDHVAPLNEFIAEKTSNIMGSLVEHLPSGLDRPAQEFLSALPAKPGEVRACIPQTLLDAQQQQGNPLIGALVYAADMPNLHCAGDVLQGTLRPLTTPPHPTQADGKLPDL